MRKETILITGCAGFIGFHTVKKYCETYSFNIVGIDNLNDYYDVSLKESRINELSKFKNFSFIKLDLKNNSKINEIFKKNNFFSIIHLAAQPGVRYSIDNPHAYIDSNIYGFLNILEQCKKYKINLIYASSSSVYGGSNKNIENNLYDESIETNSPLSIYGFTKRCNELMANTYSNLFNVNSIGLRFFTVYGPFGRPDMAYFKFTRKILNQDVINVYNYGNHIRSFTYIDDIVDGIDKLFSHYILNKEPKYCEIFNLCSKEQIQLIDFINILEKNLNKKAQINFLSKQLGDVNDNSGNSNFIKDKVGWMPKVNFEKGIKEFISWYKTYYDLV